MLWHSMVSVLCIDDLSCYYPRLCLCHDYLSEIFDIGAGFWSTIAAALAYLGGAAYALNLREDDF